MRKTAITTILRWFGLILICLVLSPLFYFVAVRAVHPTLYPNRDFFTFWLGGHMTALSQNPYSTDLWVQWHHTFGASWIPNATYIYPLPLSLFFAPLGLLPLYQASVLWVILTQFMILLSIVLLFRLSLKFQIKHLIYFILAVGVFSRSITTTLIHGQISGFLLLVIASIICLWERGRWWHGATLLSILVLKPNLGVPIVALLLIYLFQRRKASALIAAGVSGLVLLLMGFIQNPNWLIEFWGAGNIKLSETFGFSATIWGASAHFCNYQFSCAVGFGSFICILLFIGYLFILWKNQSRLSPGIVVGLAITIMLITTPYTWPYDQLLLIAPVIIVINRFVEDNFKILPTGMAFFVICIVSMALLDLSVKSQLEIWNVGIPLCVLGLLSWYVFRKQAYNEDTKFESTHL